MPMDVFPEIVKVICNANNVLEKAGLTTLPLKLYYKQLSEKFELSRTADEQLKNLCTE